MVLLSAFVCGVIFAAGLIVSQMVNPAKVLGFLDLSGSWDPTLALVFLGGLAVAVPGVQLVKRRGTPLFGKQLSLPGRSAIDIPLIAGAAIFGAGWGLAGLCPGPAVTALGTGTAKVIYFVAAMIAGIAVYKLYDRTRSGSTDG